MNEVSRITRLLRDWSDGNREAVDELLPLVYDELHRQAHLHLRRERAGHTLQTSDLMHEAYIRLVDQRHVEFDSRSQFFAFAARIMRNILVDHARAKLTSKRGAGALKISLTNAGAAIREQDLDLLALDQALDRLAKIDEQQVKLVELRYFGGLSLEATADAMRISRATAARDWTAARAWLHRELTR